MKPNSLESQLKKALEEELLYSALSDELESQILEESYIEDEEEYDEEEYEDYDDEYEDEEYEEDEERATIVSNQKAKKNTKREKRKKRLKRLQNDVKAKSVIIVILTLLVNTYAWFIYSSMVSTSLQMHIKGWNFNITNLEDDEFIFQVEEVYPGMEEAVKIMTAENKGETRTTVRCEFQSIRVFNDTVEVGDNVLDQSGNPTGATHTSDTLYQLLKSYPFDTDIFFGATEYTGTPVVMNQGQNMDIKFAINWEYEVAGDADAIAAQDAIDTKWGEDAYDFKNTPGNSDYCVEIKLKVVAEQVDE